MSLCLGVYLGTYELNLNAKQNIWRGVILHDKKKKVGGKGISEDFDFYSSNQSTGKFCMTILTEMAYHSVDWRFWDGSFRSLLLGYVLWIHFIVARKFSILFSIWEW